MSVFLVQITQVNKIGPRLFDARGNKMAPRRTYARGTKRTL